MMNNFIRLLQQAQSGDQDAVLDLISLYQELIRKFSFVNGAFDEDLNQMLVQTVLDSIQKFSL